MAVLAGGRRRADTVQRGRIRRLSGVDRMYLALESDETPMHAGAFIVVDGRTLLDGEGHLRLAELRARLANTAAGIPDLRRVVRPAGHLAGGPIWADAPAFRIERHVDEVPLPPGVMDEPAVFAFVERLMAPLLDREQPLWRLWFVTGLPDGRVGLLLVVHHALADGLGAMRLARSLLEMTPAHGTGPPGPEPIPSWPRLVVDRVAGSARTAGGLFRDAAWRALADTLWSFGAAWSEVHGKPRTSLNGRVGRGRRLVVIRLDARAAKRIARAHGVGVDDVILDLVAGGLRALLTARGEPIGDLAPRIATAVALSPADRDAASGNHFGGYVIPLPIAIADPAERLRAIAIARTEAKMTQTVTGTTAVRVWTSRFRPTRWLMGRQRLVNVIETFLPGPPRPVRLLGATTLDVVPIQPLGRNVGLTIIASSYAGRLSLAVRTDPHLFPDLDTFTAAIEADVRSWAMSLASGSERVTVGR